jgi:hypothetical protein
MGVVEPTTVVDHIEPHLGNQEKFWDQSNWQPSCDWHHNAIKQKLEQLWFDGSLDVVGLRLTSPEAIGMSRLTPRRAAFINVDGWPVG